MLSFLRVAVSDAMEQMRYAPLIRMLFQAPADISISPTPSKRFHGRNCFAPQSSSSCALNLTISKES